MITVKQRDNVIANTKKFICDFYKNDSSGHDYWHSIRVYNNARKIAKLEKADLFVVELAALLHDVDDEKLVSKSNNNAVNFLKFQNIDKEIIEKVRYIIENQSFKKSIGNNKRLKTIEAMIVQDADRLDAIYGGSRRKEMHNPIKGINNYQTQTDYLNNDNTIINHFYEKLLKLKGLMNTKTAKALAAKRHKFMEDFLKEFFGEWGDN
jgi:uncharacterized protein